MNNKTTKPPDINIQKNDDNKIFINNTERGISPEIKTDGIDNDIDLNLNCKGKGKTIINSDAENAILSSSYDKNLILQTNNEKTGTINIQKGENGNITIAPNGSGIVQISGNLTVTGVTTTVSSTNTNISDPIIEVGEDNIIDPFNRGLKFKYNNGSSKIGFIGFDSNESKFLFIPDADDNAGKFSGRPGTIKSNLEGSITLPTNGTIGSIGYPDALSINSTGCVNLMSNINSDSITSGSLVIKGGVGISENINIGGTIGFYNKGLNLKTETQSLNTNLIIPDLEGNDGNIVVDNLEQTLSNKIFIKPKINNGDSIIDTNDNKIITFNSVKNATNELFISNSIDEYGPIIGVSNSKSKDSNIDLNLHANGTGNINLTTNKNRKISFKFDKSGENINTSFIVSSTENRTIIFPDKSDTLVGHNTIDTLSNKTLLSPIIDSPQLNGVIKLKENNISSLSFDTNNKSEILKIDTTNKLEKVSISSNLEVIGLSKFCNTITSKGNIIPENSCSASLGSEEFGWSDLFLSYTGVIYFGDNKETNLSHIPEKGLLLNDDNQLQFGTSNTYINQQTEGELNLVGESISIDGEAIFKNNITTTGNILPEKSNVSSLGSNSKEWKKLYLSESGEINIGNNQNVKLSHSPNNGINLSSTTNSSTETKELLKLTHLTNNKLANGIGTNISFTVGNDKKIYNGAILETIVTEIIDDKENFDFNIKLMEKGKSPSDKLKITSSGNLLLPNNNSIISIGETGVVKLIHTPNQLLINNNNKLAFGNSNTFIKQSNNDSLDLTSNNINFNVENGGILINSNQAKLTIGNIDSSNSMLLLNDSTHDFRIGINSETNKFEIGKGNKIGKSTAISIDKNQDVKILSNSKSSSTSTGSLVVSGGMGVLENLNIGGNILLSDSSTIGTQNNKSAISISDKGYVNINNLSLNGKNILATTDDINKLYEIEPGTALPNKAIILNNKNSINGIGTIEAKEIISTGKSIFNQLAVSDIIINDRSITINKIALIEADKEGTLNINTLNSKYFEANINIESKNKNTLKGKEINLISNEDIILESNTNNIILKNKGNIFGSFSNNKGNFAINTNSENKPAILLSDNNTKIFGKLVIPDYGTIGSTSSNSAITISNCGLVSISSLKSNIIKLSSGSKIIDYYNNELLKFSQTDNAKNEITIHNSETLSGPIIESTGDDNNIDLNLQTKGTGMVNLLSKSEKKLGFDFSKSSVKSTTILSISSKSNTTLTLPDTTTVLVGNDTNQTLSNKILSKPIFEDEGYISNIQGKELLKFNNNKTAVNYVKIHNSSTNNGPLIDVDGLDKDIDLNLSGKGNGMVKIDNSEIITLESKSRIKNKTLINPVIENNGYITDINGNKLLSFETKNNKSTNNLKITNNLRGTAPSISAIGNIDEDIDIDLIPKGKGVVKINGSPIIAATDSSTITLTNKTLDNPKIIGTAILQEASLEIKNGKNSAGFISFYENSSHGRRSIKLKAPENINKNYTVTLPEGNTTLVSLDSKQTMTNKTLSNPYIEGQISIRNLSNVKGKIEFYPDSSNENNKLILTTPNKINNTAIITLPDKNDTLVGLTTIDILRNKTLIKPLIQQIKSENENIITIPDTNDTLVARNTIESLSNKTFITPKIKDNDYISTLNGSKYLAFSETKNAVNEITISNSATKIGPKISSTGKDTSIDLSLEAKGSGDIIFISNLNKSLIFNLKDSYKNSSLTLKSNSSSNRIITFPDATDTLVAENTTQILTNKTMISTDLQGATSISNGSTSSGYLDFYENSSNGRRVITLCAPENINKDCTLTLPQESTTLVGLSTNDKLTNKTLISPTIDSAILSGSIKLSNDSNSEISFDTVSKKGLLKIISTKNLEKLSIAGSLEISNKNMKDLSDLVLSEDNSKITFGTKNPVSLIHSSNQILIDSDNKLAFGSSEKYIHQLSNSQLAIVSNESISLKTNNNKSEIILENNDEKYGSFSTKDGNLIIKSGNKLTTAITCSGKDVKIEGSLTIGNSKFTKDDIISLDNVIPGLAAPNKAVILDNLTNIKGINKIESGPIESTGKSIFQHMTVKDIIFEEKSITINGTNDKKAMVKLENNGTLNINSINKPTSNINMNADGEITLNSNKNINLHTTKGNIILKEEDNVYASIGNNDGNMFIKSGKSTLINFNENNLTINGNIKCNYNLTIDDTKITSKDFKKINNIFDGIASPNKALIVDELLNIKKIGNISSASITSTGKSTFDKIEVGQIIIDNNSIKLKGSHKNLATLDIGQNGNLDIKTQNDNGSNANINIHANGYNNISGSEVSINSLNDITLDSNSSNILLKNNKTIFGSLVGLNNNLVIKSGKSNEIAIKFNGSDVILGGTLTIGSYTINDKEISVLNNVDYGIAKPEKALILDRNKNINGIAKMEVTNLITNGISSFSQEITPKIKGGSSIGNKSLGWNNLYLSEKSNIYLGEFQNVSIEHIPNNGIQLNSHTNIRSKTKELLNLKHTTSETPINGIGSNLAFTVQTNKFNSKKGMLLETKTTDISLKNEKFDFIVNLMDNGLEPSEKFRVSSNGLATSLSGFESIDGPIKAQYNSKLPVCTLTGGSETKRNPILKLENSQENKLSDVAINFKSNDKSFTLGYDSQNNIFALSSTNNLMTNIFSVNSSGIVTASGFSGSLKAEDIKSGKVGPEYMSPYQTQIKSVFSENLKVGESESSMIHFNNKKEISFYCDTKKIILNQSSLAPGLNSSLSLGSSLSKWSDLYLTNDSTISFGKDNDVTLTHVTNKGILLNDEKQLQFGDSETYINQSTDKSLNIVSKNINLESDQSITLDSKDSDITLKNNGNKYAKLTNNCGELVIKSGSSDITAITCTGPNVNISGSLSIAGIELNPLTIQSLDSITPGIATSNKMMVLDINKNITGLGKINCEEITTYGISKFSKEIIPLNSGEATIGNKDSKWSSMYLDEDSSIYMGNQQNISIKHSNKSGLIISNIDNTNEITEVLNLNNKITTDNKLNVGVNMSFSIKNEEEIVKKGLVLETVATNKNNTNFDFIVKLMKNKNKASEKFRITSDGNLNLVENNSVLTIGSKGSVSLTHSTNQLLINENSKIAFGNSDNFINQSEDENLTLNSDKSICLNSNEDIILNSDDSDIILKSKEITYGSISNNNGNMIIRSGTTKLIFDKENIIIPEEIKCKGINSKGSSEFEKASISNILIDYNSIIFKELKDKKSSIEVSNEKGFNINSNKSINLNSNEIITINTNKSEIILTDKEKTFAKFINNNGNLQINSGIDNLPLINCYEKGLDIQGNISFTTSLICGKTELLESDFKKLNNTENGIGKPNKALILDYNKNISNIGLLECKNIKSTGFSLFNKVILENIQIHEKSITIKSDNRNYSKIYHDDNNNLNLNNYNETETSNININSCNSIKLNSTSDIILNTVDSEIKLTNNGKTFGSFSNNNNNLTIKSGNNPVIKFSETNIKLFGKIDCASINSKGVSTFDKINIGYIKINDRSISFLKSNNYTSLSVDTEGQLNISNTNNQITKANININADGLIQLKSTKNITFDTLDGDIIFKNNGKTIVKFIDDNNKLVIKSDTINYATFTDSNLKIEGSLNCDNITSTGISIFEEILVKDTINFDSNNISINSTNSSILLKENEKTFVSFTNDDGKLIINSESTSINFNQNSLSINNSLELINYLSIDNEIIEKEDIIKVNKITPGIAQPNKALIIDDLKNIIGIKSIKCNDIETTDNISIFNKDNPCLKIGTTKDESLSIEILKGKSNKTAEEIRFSSHTESTNAEHGKFTFVIDDTQKLEIDDFGLTINDGDLIIPDLSTIGSVSNTSAIKINNNGSLTLSSKSNEFDESLTLTNICSKKIEIGTRSSIGFNIKTPSNNNKGMIIETILTDNNKNKESFDYVLKLMDDGNEANEKLRVSSTGHLTFGNNNDHIETDSKLIKNKYVGQLQGEFVTTLQIDINDCITNNKLENIIKKDNTNDTYLTKFNSNINGFIYKVEMMCIEKPKGGGSNIILYASNKPLEKKLSTNNRKNIKLIDSNGNWNIGKRKVSSEELTITDGLSDYYLYLINEDGSELEKYKSGKFIIKLYGANF